MKNRKMLADGKAQPLWCWWWWRQRRSSPILTMTTPAITDLNHGGAIFSPVLCSTEIILEGSPAAVEVRSSLCNLFQYQTQFHVFCIWSILCCRNKYQ